MKFLKKALLILVIILVAAFGLLVLLFGKRDIPLSELKCLPLLNSP